MRPVNFFLFCFMADFVNSLNKDNFLIQRRSTLRDLHDRVASTFTLAYEKIRISWGNNTKKENQ